MHITVTNDTVQIIFWLIFDSLFGKKGDKVLALIQIVGFAIPVRDTAVTGKIYDDL